ncbi:MAG TPA: proton-conducting transporter membrane subunit [Anaerolineales bacterium]|nr:proton-conducting transporter membrane subunit [Anaerolineales bacterium]
MGVFSLLLLTERAAAWTGAFTCIVLALLALVVPIDSAMLIGPVSLKIGSTASLLGRNLIIGASEGPLLGLFFGTCALWFFGAEAAGIARRLVPFGLTIAALLVASIAVQPFLYAALLIEMAALASVPLLAPQGQAPGKSVIKFLAYQTLGMPCILLAGWLLAGVETSPGDLALTVQATVMLSLGFAFLLAVFPLHDWIPGLMADSHPYLAGFLLWMLPSVIIVFAMSFLNGYSWLRSSSQVVTGLRTLGLLMLVTSGISSAFESSLGRLFGQAAIAENGLALLATSLAVANRADLVFPLFVPRGLVALLWALALSILRRTHGQLRLEDLRRGGRTNPWASAAIVLAALSTAGFPLLAGFPARIDVWDALADVSGGGAVWFLVGLIGLMIGALRQLTVVVGSPPDAADIGRETLLERSMLGAGMLAIVVLGLFPQLTGFVVDKLPVMFEHLSR